MMLRPAKCILAVVVLCVVLPIAGAKKEKDQPKAAKGNMKVRHAV